MLDETGWSLPDGALLIGFIRLLLRQLNGLANSGKLITGASTLTKEKRKFEQLVHREWPLNERKEELVNRVFFIPIYKRQISEYKNTP